MQIYFRAGRLSYKFIPGQPWKGLQLKKKKENTESQLSSSIYLWMKKSFGLFSFFFVLFFVLLSFFFLMESISLLFFNAKGKTVPMKSNRLQHFNSLEIKRNPPCCKPWLQLDPFRALGCQYACLTAFTSRVQLEALPLVLPTPHL